MPISRSPSPENDVFGISDNIVPERQQKEAGTTFTTFDGLLETPLILYEDLKDGCGGQLWPAGMVLSRYMLSYHKSDYNDKYVIELGAGGGLVGLAVALGCNTSQPIQITDQEPMLQLMQKNISLNGLSTGVRASVYNWGSRPAPTFPTNTGHPDILLAADCVYFEPAFPLLLQTLQDLVGPNTKCFFCFKKRRKADMRFIKEMKKTFVVSEVEYDNRDRDRREHIFLHLLSRKAASDDTPTIVVAFKP